MQKKLLALIFLICLVASPFLLGVPAVKATTTSQTITIDIGTGTIDHYYLNSPGYSNFIMTIDCSNATFGSGYGTILQFVDVYDLYGFLVASDGNGGMSFSDSYNTGESIMSYYPGNYANYTMVFNGANVEVQALNNGYEIATTTSCTHISDSNPITQFIFNPTNVYNPSHGTVKITIDYYLPPSPSPTPTPSPTPSPTPEPSFNDQYTTVYSDFTADNSYETTHALDHSFSVQQPFTVSVHFHNVPSPSNLSEGTFVQYDVRISDGESTIFDLGIIVVNAPNDPEQPMYGNFSQINNGDNIFFDSTEFVNNTFTFNDTLTITGDGTTESTYFGTTLVDSFQIPVDATASSISVDYSLGLMGGDGQAQPTVGSETTTIMSAAWTPGSPTPTPTTHHGGGGDTTQFTNPTTTPYQSSSPVPIVAPTKLSTVEIIGGMAAAVIAVLATMLLLRRKR